MCEQGIVAILMPNRQSEGIAIANAWRLMLACQSTACHVSKDHFVRDRRHARPLSDSIACMQMLAKKGVMRQNVVQDIGHHNMRCNAA